MGLDLEPEHVVEHLVGSSNMYDLDAIGMFK